MYEKDKKKKKEKLKARKKARKEEFKIIGFRAQYMTMELIKKENKGKVFTVKRKYIKLGEFVGFLSRKTQLKISSNTNFQ